MMVVMFATVVVIMFTMEVLFAAVSAFPALIRPTAVVVAAIPGPDLGPVRGALIGMTMVCPVTVLSLRLATMLPVALTARLCRQGVLMGPALMKRML